MMLYFQHRNMKEWHDDELEENLQNKYAIDS